MIFNRPELKRQAKTALGESRTSPYMVAGIYVCVTLLLTFLQNKLMGLTLTEEQYMHYLETNDVNYVFNIVIRQMPKATEIVVIVMLELAYRLLTIGFRLFTLYVWRRRPNSVGNLLDGFGIFFKLLWLYILIGVFTFLWSLLLIVPGIIAAYSYRQAIYLLLDDPSKRAIDCIRESKAMMKGHKAELFVLDLSFIGWRILLSIPYIGSAVGIYAYPYMFVTYAGYYDFVRGGPAETGGFGDSDLPPWERPRDSRGDM